MPSISADGPPHLVHTTANSFVDSAGRTLWLRGVNLSGSSKAPVGQPSYILEGYWEDAEAGGKDFIGQPFCLEDGSADVHLARLRGWGFNCIRYPVTWEALEHEGPGKYDHDFIHYTVRVLRKCAEYGFYVYMDPHQDVWSRFSGGSGAPFWTLHACGMDPRNFTATQAAILHSEFSPDPQSGGGGEHDPQKLPAMIWSTNYGRLVSQTLFALFFAGKVFAPKCVIDGVNIQDYLQGHFISAFKELAHVIAESAPELLDTCIIGWDGMNEPAEGFVGYEDLNIYPLKQGSTLKKGSTPTPAQSFKLGVGQAQVVDNWEFAAFGPKKSGTVTIDPAGKSIWLPEGGADDGTDEVDGVSKKWGWKRGKGWRLGTCIWALHGVWDVESGEILLPTYFRFSSGKGEVNFLKDHWLPHLDTYFSAIRVHHPNAIAFVQPPVFAKPPPVPESILGGRACYAAHYYDGLTLLTRHWNWFNADALGLIRGMYGTMLGAVRVGEGAIRKGLRDQLGYLKDDALQLGARPSSSSPSASTSFSSSEGDWKGRYPTLIGEIGTPMDMDSKRAYGYTDDGKYAGDYSRQERALDASLNAADGTNGIGWTVWTYCADSSHRWGDGWNMEDLSLWSAEGLRSSRTSGRLRMGSKAGKGSKVALLGSANSSGANTPAPGASALSLATTLPASRNSVPPSPATTHVVPSSIAGTNRSSVTLTTAANQPKSDAKFHSPSSTTSQRVPQPWSTPFAFLTDGARAYRAFARPWPVHTVGIPTSVEFDIGKASLKVVVRVTADDAPRAPASEEDVKKGEEDWRATEIFLPIVQFAADSAISSAPSSRSSSGLSTPAPSASMPTLAPNFASADPDDAYALSLDVKVSEGTWSVSGQTLRWWYDPPQASEAPKEVWIEVRRKGGVIKLKSLAVLECESVYEKDQGEGEDEPGREGKERTCATWLGECVDGCVVG
ncbi:glycoside hydrolase family 5 protein [Coniophora puteana RWD-64-598 SS2]|uniref:Glycoside hydrolase family 5 protein n=1 Tax=Coniophora puteana (strain RWD-64-598) TaxID=741705 RepID=A0A5M3N363_CONPW|nr:glycoside hydrolase family 5 protein [Coniophora puteana RWD-64-598 SS2]EIW85830.1 glycoside hydrolase family 5 protein [Coniophora puteana RWD-64-598 SS2]